MRKIRIALVTDDLDYGGSQRLLVDIATRLNRNIFEVNVFATTTGGKILEDELLQNGIDYHILGKTLNNSLLIPSRISALFREWKPDIVHTFRFTANTYGRIGAFLSHTPVIIGTEHVLERKKLVHKLIDRSLAFISDCIVVTTGEISEQVHRDHGLPYHRIRIIDECIDLSRFKFVDHMLFKKNITDTNKFFNVGIVGRLVPQKGHWIFLEAIRRARKYRSKIKGIIVGDGELRRQLEQWVSDQKLKGAIEFWGFRNDLPDVFDEFDLFAMSSLREATPLVLLAAAACGVPFVCTAVGGIPEIFQDYVHGRLTTPENPDELSNAIIWSIDNYQEACSMARKASELVNEKYGLEVMLRLHETMYRELLKS